MKPNRFLFYNKILIEVFLLLFCSAEICLAQRQGFYIDKNKKKAVIPFELHNNLIVLPVIVQNKFPMKFILDTGIRPTVFINKSVAESMNIVSERKLKLKGIGNSGEVDALVSGPVSISMPGLKSTGISVLVLEEDFLELERHLGTHIHGIIGYDIFGRFAVKIDYVKKKIELIEAREFRPKKRYFPIDLKIKDSKPIASLDLILANSDSMRTNLLVDTGSGNALVLNVGSDERIKIPEKNIETVIGRGLVGEIRGRIGRINEFNFGRTRMHDVIASFPDESVFSLENTYQRNGSVGGEVLRRFTVIFDFYQGKMYLKPNTFRKYPFEYNMSGLEFSAEGEKLNVFVIKDIRPGSAASECGFEKGDVIIRLNNISADKLTLNKIYTELNRKAGKKVSLTVYRKNSTLQKTFRLKREI